LKLGEKKVKGRRNLPHTPEEEKRGNHRTPSQPTPETPRAKKKNSQRERKGRMFGKRKKRGRARGKKSMN